MSTSETGIPRQRESYLVASLEKREQLAETKAYYFTVSLKFSYYQGKGASSLARNTCNQQPMSLKGIQKEQKQGKLNVETVIQGVIDNKPNTQIAKEAGSLANSKSALSQATARVKKSDSYQKAVKSTIQRMEALRDKAILALENTDPASVDYDKQVSAMERIIKTLALLSGQATERVEVKASDVAEFLNIA